MAAHRNRLRVRVRSCVTNQVLRYVSEAEARIMIAENADGSDMLGNDGRPLEAVARRISLRKHALEIKLIAPLRQERTDRCTIPRRAVENNAFIHNGVRLSEKDSMHQLDADVELIEAWPAIHDSKAAIISAGTVYGVFCPYPPLDPSHVVTFA